MRSDYYHVHPNMPEWEYMWEELAKHPVNAGRSQPTQCLNEGEVWQYMGSDERGHSFRHRCHPHFRENNITIRRLSLILTPSTKELIKLRLKQAT